MVLKRVMPADLRRWLYRRKRSWQRTRHTRSLMLTDEQKQAISGRHELESLLPPSWSLEEYQGDGNITYRVGNRYILQIPRLDQADSAARGARIAQLTHSSGVSTARLVAADGSSSEIPHPYYIYERRSGVSLYRYLKSPSWSIETLAAIGRRVGEELAILHSIPLSTVEAEILTELPRLTFPSPRDIERDLADVTFLSPYYKGLLSSVISNMPEAEADGVDHVLLHADLGVRNVLIDRGRFNGIIDWGGAAIGPPALEFVAMRPRIAGFALDGYLSGTNDEALRTRVFAGHLARLVRQMKAPAVRWGRENRSLERRLLELVISDSFREVS